MPIRKVPKNYRNVTGVAATTKAVGEPQFESTLERDFLTLLEFSPEVERFEVQPLKIEWRDDRGYLCSYTPDVLVEFKPEIERAPWLCEIKYRADLRKNWLDLRPKLRRGVYFAKQKHWRFRVFTEVEIRNQYLVNVRFLAPFKFRNIPETSSEIMLRRLQQLQRATLAELTASLAGSKGVEAEWLPVLWHLMAHHRIGVELENALTMDTPVWSLS